MDGVGHHIRFDERRVELAVSTIKLCDGADIRILGAGHRAGHGPGISLLLLRSYDGVFMVLV